MRRLHVSGHDFSNDVLQNHIAPNGKCNLERVHKLNGLLLALGHRRDVRTIIDSTDDAHIRAALVPFAIVRKIDIRE
jgi:hypothetical protein